MGERQTTIDSVSVHELTLPLREPFGVSMRTATLARNVLVKIQASDKTTGLGLCAPAEYVTGETIETVKSDMGQIVSLLLGSPVITVDQAIRQIGEILDFNPAARAAIEMAILDLWARHHSINLWRHYGEFQTMLDSDLTIPLVAPEIAHHKAVDAWTKGFRSLKIKVGDANGVDTDLARLEAVSKGAPDAAIRVDANQAFTALEASSFITAAVKIAPKIELVEQPVNADDHDGLAQVHETTKQLRIHLFADESVKTARVATQLLEAGAIDGINIKLMKSALAESKKIVDVAKLYRAQLMIGCMLEADLSLSAACAFAAGVGGFEYIDIDSHHLLSPCDLFTGGYMHDGPILNPSMNDTGWGSGLNETSECFVNAPVETYAA